MQDLSFLSEQRRQVIENISAAVASGNSFAKVEIGDPTPTEDEIRRVILPFDNKRHAPVRKIKALAARLMADSLTKKVNGNTVIVGLENLCSVNGGAIITATHYNPTDSTPYRLAAKAARGRTDIHIIIQESNVFMKGFFGFLMNNCNTHPVSRSTEYMNKNLRPVLDGLLKSGELLLIYPEQEMWFNYKKPRELREGAYHFAASYGVPIIPTFTEMITLDGERDKDGLLPVQHILHILPPIYPDSSLSIRENRIIMQNKDYNMRVRIYEETYGIRLDGNFIPQRDIAGIVPSVKI